jgi:hypothetical protein
MVTVVCEKCGKVFAKGCVKCPWCGDDQPQPPPVKVPPEANIRWFLINGCGIGICGEQELEPAWSAKLDRCFPEIKKEYPESWYVIITNAITLAWVPVIPLSTEVHAKSKYDDRVWGNNDRYIHIYDPCGEGKICWKHVKGNIGFYVFPALLLLVFLYMIIYYIWSN